MARKKVVEEEPEPDPTAWILENEFANFVLMNSNEIVSFLVFCVVVVEVDIMMLFILL